MAYAAYREYAGTVRARCETTFKVLDVTVPSVDACRVRRGIAACKGAGVLRCEPLMRVNATCESGAPRARLLIRLPLASYACVMHCLLECAPDGEIGHLTSWREHLQRYGIANGG
ncbi:MULTISPECIES: hypothetical protein [unclassified Variovorax]|jgi:hypothetical protein|uniref:hypothetical protein n=1 Tax=unclassified Variovorax TaxID=663243 RepID=UPI000F7D9E9A|nr:MULTISPECIES: hypothetical protein [unclassified Variovorax]RSZ40890.1 hypothetical protein EJO70_13365 [Variovorax sp. 553]RSZ42201.1 hypothetical protein EJO71_15675 [Variovorax sp. 679]